jgi:hypothetical protein
MLKDRADIGAWSGNEDSCSFSYHEWDISSSQSLSSAISVHFAV